MMNKSLLALGLAMASLSPQLASAAAQVRITEWMYAGTGGEFVEFTNMGTTALDLSGWSYDDDSRQPGAFDLSALGLIGAGESVVITESSAEAFRAEWNLAVGVKVLGGYTNNLGRNDEINLFDALGALVDRLTYGDQSFAGSIRTQNISGRPGTAQAVGANQAGQWVFSSLGDAQGSYASVNGAIGSPGLAAFAPAVPEPSTWALVLAGLATASFAGGSRARAGNRH